jgi:hypothetical protein
MLLFDVPYNRLSRQFTEHAQDELDPRMVCESSPTVCAWELGPRRARDSTNVRIGGAVAIARDRRWTRAVPVRPCASRVRCSETRRCTDALGWAASDSRSHSLIATLALGGTNSLDSAKVGILSGSVLAGVVGTIVLRYENSSDAIRACENQSPVGQRAEVGHQPRPASLTVKLLYRDHQVGVGRVWKHDVR